MTTPTSNDVPTGSITSAQQTYYANILQSVLDFEESVTDDMAQLNNSGGTSSPSSSSNPSDPNSTTSASTAAASTANLPSIQSSNRALSNASKFI